MNLRRLIRRDVEPPIPPAAIEQPPEPTPPEPAAEPGTAPNTADIQIGHIPLSDLFGLVIPRQPPELPEPKTPEELRRRNEIEANRSPQPFEWASHVYVTVHGEVRWRCCGNLFEDDHSIYCASPGDPS